MSEDNFNFEELDKMAGKAERAGINDLSNAVKNNKTSMANLIFTGLSNKMKIILLLIVYFTIIGVISNILFIVNLF
jgi:hypothetical protein